MVWLRKIKISYQYRMYSTHTVHTVHTVVLDGKVHQQAGGSLRVPPVLPGPIVAQLPLTGWFSIMHHQKDGHSPRCSHFFFFPRWKDHLLPNTYIDIHLYLLFFFDYTYTYTSYM